MRRGLALLTFAAATLAAQGASAQSAPDDALYAQGAALRAQHRDEEALALYQGLHARTQAPRALAQVALAEGAVGRWVDAEAHLVGALADGGDPWVARNRAALEASLATMRAHVGSLVVACAAPGASVWVEGRRVGGAGTPLRVPAGTVNFEVRAEGAAPVARVATVPAGGVAREEVRLATPEPARVGEGAAPAVAARPAVATPRDERPAPSGLRRTLGWVGVGTGAALLVGGAALWAVGRGAAGDYNDDPACPGVGAPMQSDVCASRLSTAQTLEPIAWTGMALGLGLGAAGAVLLATGGGARAAAALRACAVGGAGVSCRVSF